jgi:hypothetical protein
MRVYKQFDGFLFLLAGLAAFGPIACGKSPTGMGFEEGPNAEVTVDGLHKVINSSYRDAWVKPDANFASYTAVQLDPVEISYRRKPRRSQYGGTEGNFALTETQMANMKRYFREAFSAELEKASYYELAEAPGPTVLRLVPSIIDLQINVPTEPAAGRDRVYAMKVGKMTLLLEIHDSLSGEILARVADRREARLHGGYELRQSNPVSNTDAIQRLFRRWAEILRKRLDEVHAIQPPPGRAPEE